MAQGTTNGIDRIPRDNWQLLVAVAVAVFLPCPIPEKSGDPLAETRHSRFGEYDADHVREPGAVQL